MRYFINQTAGINKIKINKFPNISRNDLNRLESKVFNQNFPQINPEKRIERLEQQMFGAAQSGDLKTRLDNLKTAAKYSNENNMNYPQTAARTGWKGLALNMGNSFCGGRMTGFTPPISPFYNNYGYGMNPFMNVGNGGFGMNNGYNSGYNRGPGGYREYDSTQNVGTGMGVTILD